MNESQGKAMIRLGSDTNYLKSVTIQKKYVFFTGSCVSFALSVPCGFEHFHRAGQGWCITRRGEAACFSFGQGAAGRDIHHCLLNPNSEGIVCVCLVFGGGGIGI